LHDALRVIDRQWAQGNSVKDRENRRVRPDPQRQRQSRNQSEAWVLQQHSRAVAQVLPQILNPSHAASVAPPLFRLLHAAESLESGNSRLFRIHPEADVLLSLPLDMPQQLIVEFSFNL